MPRIVITIGRQYGSGGRLIGEKLASKLGIAFYDKKIIELAAKQSGISKDVIESNEGTKSTLLDYMGLNEAVELPLSEQVFIIQSDIIKKTAEKESCVIIGRCADYLLKDLENCIKVFVYAPLEYRVGFAQANYGNAGDVKAFVQKSDRQRKSYYEYYTEQLWGNCENYDISFDSSIGVDNSVSLIAGYLGIIGAIKA